MYLILVKYFYYFYYLKKNKKFKFFILIDLIFFLMKKYFRLLMLRKRLLKYKNLIKRTSNLSISIKKINLLSKLDLFLQNKINEYNDFIINFLPIQLLPLGNRKRFYNLINKKFKRFFLLIKKKLNKKFFFFYLVQLFRKIKFLFLKSDAFLNKKTFLFDFFSILSLESNYFKLIQVYKQNIKKDTFLKNRFLSFFNMIYFFLYRLDYYLFKSFSFINLNDIRNIIFKLGIYVNNKKIQTIHYFLNKYDLVELPISSSFFNGFSNKYIFLLQRYFSFISSYSYKKQLDIKKNYYLALYKKILKLDSNFLYLFRKKIKCFNSSEYLVFLDQLYSFFFKIKKFKSIYNFDNLNNGKNIYKLEYQFPFFLKKKKKRYLF